MRDLKPCPFCGGEAREEEADDGGKFIECSTCSACTALHYDRAENLVSAWNRRRDAESALREMREAIRDMLDLHLAHHNHPTHAAARAAIIKTERDET